MKMNEPRFTFQDVSIKMRSTFRFYDDRIEQEWDTLFRKGISIYPVTAISGRLSEQTTFAYGLGRPLRLTAIQLVVGLVLNLGFDRPLLHRIGFVFYLLSGLSALVAITTLKKDKWIYILKDDGYTLFFVREKGMKGANRDDLVRELQRYVKPANQPPEATPGQRPPSAPSSSSGAPQL